MPQIAIAGHSGSYSRRFKTLVVPEAILDRQLVKKGNAPIPQILLKWSKLPSTSATWEDLYIVQQRFPDALAWGQASLPGGADVMTKGQPEDKARSAKA